jgi:hypothetical protein
MIDRPIWIAMVAKLCCPQDQAGAARAMLAYLPMLADFPPAAFTARSAEAVARQNRYTPSYAQLRDALADWWRDYRPEYAAIGQDKPRGWNDTDEVWYGYWHRRQSEDFRMAPNMTRIPGDLSVREHCASLVRTYSRLAWARIEGEAGA